MELDAPLLCVSATKVTSKGAGLNPNAKVWQEMPVASREVVTNSSHWPPSDLSDGERRPRASSRSPEATLSRGERSAVVFWTSEPHRLTFPQAIPSPRPLGASPSPRVSRCWMTAALRQRRRWRSTEWTLQIWASPLPRWPRSPQVSGDRPYFLSPAALLRVKETFWSSVLSVP